MLKRPRLRRLATLAIACVVAFAVSPSVGARNATSVEPLRSGSGAGGGGVPAPATSTPPSPLAGGEVAGFTNPSTVIRIVDPRGRPVARARISMWSAKGDMVAVAVTDRQGIVVLGLPRDEVLTISLDEFGIEGHVCGPSAPIVIVVPNLP